MAVSLGSPSLGKPEIAKQVSEAAGCIREACRLLDIVAAGAPSTVTDRLNDVEGQADLGVTANRLLEFAAVIRKEAMQAALMPQPRPPAPSKSYRPAVKQNHRTDAEQKS